jgi:hypothetical protein
MVRVRVLRRVSVIYSSRRALDNGDSFVLDCPVQVLHEIKLDVIRLVIREDRERIRG